MKGNSEEGSSEEGSSEVAIPVTGQPAAGSPARDGYAAGGCAVGTLEMRDPVTESILGDGPAVESSGTEIPVMGTLVVASRALACPVVG